MHRNGISDNHASLLNWSELPITRADKLFGQACLLGAHNFRPKVGGCSKIWRIFSCLKKKYFAAHLKGVRSIVYESYVEGSIRAEFSPPPHR
mmetsp:Transcript_2638/g.7012  ORF Transcript_2638/g.7012 Transcript_2638/m.7012 type:complete len:92 (-) Transcript_2638:10-285(-)